jgi:Ca2+-binding EF-hand superfamily protein
VRIREIFNTFDSKGDGVIDDTEFWELCCSLGREITLEQASAGLKTLDLNKDGKVDFEDFHAW